MAKPKYVKFIQIGLTASQVKAINRSFVERIVELASFDVDPNGYVDGNIVAKALVPLSRVVVEDQQDRILQCMEQALSDEVDLISCAWVVDIDDAFGRKALKQIANDARANIKPMIALHAARKRAEEIEQLEQRAYELGFKLVAGK